MSLSTTYTPFLKPSGIWTQILHWEAYSSGWQLLVKKIFPLISGHIQSIPPDIQFEAIWSLLVCTAWYNRKYLWSVPSWMEEIPGMVLVSWTSWDICSVPWACSNQLAQVTGIAIFKKNSEWRLWLFLVSNETCEYTISRFDYHSFLRGTP